MLGIGVLVGVIGMLISVGGPILDATVTNSLFYNGLRSYLVIKSKDDKGYDDWAGGLDRKNPYYMVFHMWNLTNADDVRLTTAKPIYESVGPYIYRRYRKAVDVSFLDNGNQIKFSTLRDYSFEREMSVGDDSDIIVNVNPAFTGIMAQAGSEQNMVVAAAGTVIKKSLDWLTGPFIPLYVSYRLAEFLQPAMDDTIRQIEQKLPNHTEARNYFLKQWVNATSTPEYGNWTGLLLSKGGKPSGISQESAEMLLDPNQDYSLLHPVDGSTAYMWDQALVNSTYKELLMTGFGLTEDQLGIIWDWRLKTFAPEFMHPHFKSQFNVTELSDLGWVQWMSAAPLNGSFATDTFPQLEDLGFLCEFEYCAISQGPQFPSVEFTKNIMNPTTGLSNYKVFQDFMKYQNDGGTNFTKWGLTPDQAADFGSFGKMYGMAQVKPDILNRLGDSGGLIVAKSVNNWAFNCDDYVLNLVDPDSPPCSLLVNDTYYPPSTVWSGKDDLNKINQYTKWRDSELITDYWNESVPVHGNTESGQFQPFLENGKPIWVVDPYLMRPIKMNHTGNDTVKDISVRKYVVDYWDTFNVSGLYYQTLPGMANMTSTRNGSTIFLSLWDFFNVPNASSWVDGINFNTTELDTNTVIYVEPTTGLAVQAFKRLQVSVQIPRNTKWFDTFENQMMPSGIYYPVAKVMESTTLSDDEARLLKSKLDIPHVLKRDLFLICILVGPAIFVAGTILIILGVRRMRTKGEYRRING